MEKKSTCGVDFLFPLAGFTLIEALIVLVIISILLGGGVYWFYQTKEKLSNKRCLNELKLILQKTQLNAKTKKLNIQIEISGQTITLSGDLNKTYTLAGCNFTSVTFGVNKFGIFYPTDVEIKNLNAPQGEPNKITVSAFGVFP